MPHKTILRPASFIYRNKNKEQVEIPFFAEDEDDLNRKALMFQEIFMGAMSGSIVGWSDDPHLDHYR